MGKPILEKTGLKSMTSTSLSRKQKRTKSTQTKQKEGNNKTRQGRDHAFLILKFAPKTEVNENLSHHMLCQYFYFKALSLASLVPLWVNAVHRFPYITRHHRSQRYLVGPYSLFWVKCNSYNTTFPHLAFLGMRAHPYPETGRASITFL